MNLLVGTSGYSYKEWKDSFYPADLPAKQMLKQLEIWMVSFRIEVE